MPRPSSRYHQQQLQQQFLLASRYTGGRIKNPPAEQETSGFMWCAVFSLAILISVQLFSMMTGASTSEYLSKSLLGMNVEEAVAALTGESVDEDHQYSKYRDAVGNRFIKKEYTDHVTADLVMEYVPYEKYPADTEKLHVVVAYCQEIDLRWLREFKYLCDISRNHEMDESLFHIYLYQSCDYPPPNLNFFLQETSKCVTTVKTGHASASPTCGAKHADAYLDYILDRHDAEESDTSSSSAFPDAVAFVQAGAFLENPHIADDIRKRIPNTRYMDLTRVAVTTTRVGNDPSSPSTPAELNAIKELQLVVDPALPLQESWLANRRMQFLASGKALQEIPREAWQALQDSMCEKHCGPRYTDCQVEEWINAVFTCAPFQFPMSWELEQQQEQQLDNNDEQSRLSADESERRRRVRRRLEEEEETENDQEGQAKPADSEDADEEEKDIIDPDEEINENESEKETEDESNKPPPEVCTQEEFSLVLPAEMDDATKDYFTVHGGRKPRTDDVATKTFLRTCESVVEPPDSYMGAVLGDNTKNKLQQRFIVYSEAAVNGILMCRDPVVVEENYDDAKDPKVLVREWLKRMDANDGVAFQQGLQHLSDVDWNNYVQAARRKHAGNTQPRQPKS